MIRRTLVSIFMALCVTVAKAQVPQQLNYQGIARNSSGSPITYQNITVRLSIIDNAAGGQLVYRETRRVKTNYVGLFNIVIGSPGATDVLGSMTGVNWSTGKKSLKLEVDPNGLNNFSLAGITELQSVPYALSASPAGTASGDLTGNYPSPSIADNAVTANKIADGSINVSKLAPAVATSISNKLNISDTAAMLAPYAGAVNITNSLGTKINISDTASMLGTYARTQRMIDSLAAVRNSIDLNNRNSLAELASKVNVADTAAMLKPYADKTYVDASSTENSIAITSESNKSKKCRRCFNNRSC